MTSKLRATTAIRSWRENPVKFVYDNFKVDPDEWQKDALEYLGGSPNPRRKIVMKACTGPGKSAVLSWIGWHRLSCFAAPGEHPKGAALSGLGRDNLRDNLWAELSKWQQRSEFLKAAFTYTKGQIYANSAPDTWFLSARSYAKDADSDAIGRSLSGLHSQFPFVLLDEIGDMPTTVGQKASQIFTGGTADGLIACAGNPTSTTGLLYQMCKRERAGAFIVTITADPDDPKRTPRVDVEHAREQIELYGRDNPWVMATILGLFPPNAFNTLLSLDDVEKAMERHYRPNEYTSIQMRLGIDVAAEGDDRTVIYPRQGLATWKPHVMRSQDGPQIAAQLAYQKNQHKAEAEYFDDTGGWASSAIDHYMAAGHTPNRVNFAAKADDPRFLNKRAEMWWRMADWVKRGGAIHSSVNEIVEELTVPTYTYQKGKFLIEPKEKIKERLGRSPDLADALALTFAHEDMPAQASTYAKDKSMARLPEYNPIEIMS